MDFYENYKSFAKKEKIYFTDENLAEFLDLVDSLKKQLILDSLSGYNPSINSRSVLTTNDEEYPNLFDLFNKYSNDYTHSSTFRVLLTKELQTNLNATTTDIDIAIFKVELDLNKRRLNENDNSITELFIEVIVKKEA